MRLPYVVTIGLVLVLSGLIVPTYGQIYPEPPSSTPINAQQNQVELTDKGTIKVGFYTDPQMPGTGDQTKLYISFLSKNTDTIQQHIDYKVFLKKGTDQVFGIPVTHTAEGSITIPFQFTDVGTYQVIVEVDGILFQPIPPETALFTVNVGSTVPEFPVNAAVILVVGIITIIAFSSRSLSRTR